jgi:DNA processing protein
MVNAHHAVLRLIRSDNIGPATFHKLLQRFGTAEQALEELPELSKKYKTKTYRPPSVEKVKQEIAELSEIGGRFVSIFDHEYPRLLKETADPPPMLAARGRVELLDRPSVAIVGARNASLNARNLARQIAQDLSQNETVVTSGLAKGIDTAAHTGGVKNGTIAVVAGGANVIYPRENARLHSEICERGLLLAEDPLNSQPNAQAFPRRNRIISGLSLGVIIIEAARKSGTLITARLAAEQGRDVFAVPGFPMDPKAEGANHLIQQGAHLITSAQDVLQLLSKEPLLNLLPNRKQAVTKSADEGDIERACKTILAILNDSPVHIDDLARDTNLESALLSSALTELELVGKLERLAGNRIAPLF